MSFVSLNEFVKALKGRRIWLERLPFGFGRVAIFQGAKRAGYFSAPSKSDLKADLNLVGWYQRCRRLGKGPKKKIVS